MPGTRPTSYRRWQRRLQAADDRAAAITGRAEAQARGDLDRAAFQAALGKLTNWQRSRYQRHGTPGDLDAVLDYARMQRGW